MNKKTYKNNIFSSKGNGKLMISGEYVVLRGAKALSIPLQLGQKMEVFNHGEINLQWEANHANGLWNTVTFNDKLTIINSSNEQFAKRLQKILRNAIKLSHIDIANLQGKKIITHMDFLPEWGFGSSSTLIYNLARYFEIDPFLLLKNTIKGSGYDIANAQLNMPIFFQLVNKEPQYIEIDFNPPFKEQIYFVYLGKKQSSKSSIRGFHKKKIEDAKIIRISAISTLMAVCNSISDFKDLMEEHESIIGEIIGEIPVMQKHFSDFKGSIKSLGAWGGDFIMATCDQPSKYVYDYFENKNLDTLFNYKKLVLSSTHN